MQAARTIAAFRSERAGVADIAGIEEPDARQGEALADQSLNEPTQDGVEGSLLGDRQRDLLERLEPHSPTVRGISFQDNDISLICTIFRVGRGGGLDCKPLRIKIHAYRSPPAHQSHSSAR